MIPTKKMRKRADLMARQIAEKPARASIGQQQSFHLDTGWQRQGLWKGEKVTVEDREPELRVRDQNS